MSQRWARPWFRQSLVLVVVELVITCLERGRQHRRALPLRRRRVFNVFWYFTIQSNILVGVTCLLLALNLGRSSTVFAVFRLMGVVAISVPVVVFHVALSHLLDLDGWGRSPSRYGTTWCPRAVAEVVALGPGTPRVVRGHAWRWPSRSSDMVTTAVRARSPTGSRSPFADVAARGYLGLLSCTQGSRSPFLIGWYPPGPQWTERADPARSARPLFMYDPVVINNRCDHWSETLLMWGNDDPHPEGTWPDSQAVCADQFDGIGDDDPAGDRRRQRRPGVRLRTPTSSPPCHPLPSAGGS